MRTTSVLLLLSAICLLAAHACTRLPSSLSPSVPRHAVGPKPYSYPPRSKAPAGLIDWKSIKKGCLVQYVTPKGMKRLALVDDEKGHKLEIIDSQLHKFSITVANVANIIEGSFGLSDLQQLEQTLLGLTQDTVKALWEAVKSDLTLRTVKIPVISQKVFGSVSPLDLFVSATLMGQHGRVFFESVPQDPNGADGITYSPLSTEVVRGRIEQQRALAAFKVAYNAMKCQGSTAPKVALPDGYEEGLKGILAKVSARAIISRRISVV